MKKYLTVFAVDWQSQFIYRLNFILWRIRNILRVLMTYFLWQGVFMSKVQIYGYSKVQMLTYVFFVLIVQSLVLSAPSADAVGGEIASGDISNYLVKPVNYLMYWFTRDLSSKLLNLIFSFGEIFLLWLFLRPEISFPATLSTFILVLFLLISALLLYFFLELAFKFVAFWTPESTWGASFVLLVFIEIFSGMIFPLDLLPHFAQNLIQFTPFPYLVYYPIAVFVGKISGLAAIRILIQSFVWIGVTYGLAKLLWHRGLRVYASEGR
jgi:ABC-2 type transport system permease protein